MTERWHEKPTGIPVTEERLKKTGRLYRCLECDWLSALASDKCPSHGATMTFVGWVEGSSPVNGQPVPKNVPVFPAADDPERKRAALSIVSGGKQGRA